MLQKCCTKAAKKAESRHSFLPFENQNLVLIDQHGIRIFAPAVLGHILSMERIAPGTLSAAPVEVITVHLFRYDANSASLLVEYFTAACGFQNIRQVLAQAAEIGFVTVIIFKEDRHDFAIGT